MISFLIALLAASAYTILSPTQNPTVEGELSWCGKPSDSLSLSKVTITPYPVKSGHDVVVHISGKSSSDIFPGASAQVTAKVGFLPVIVEHIDLCSQIPGGCPFSKSVEEQSLAISQFIPGYAPAGHLNLEISIVNGNGESIGCIKGAVQVTK